MRTFVDGINLPVPVLQPQLNITQFQRAFDNFLSPISKMNADFDSNKHLVRFGHLNTASIPKHRDEIQRTVVGTDLDIFAASETNIKAGTPSHRFTIPGYKLIRHDRNHTTKGGVGLYFKNIYKPKKIDVRYGALQPEMLFAEVEINKNMIAVGVIYKSPKEDYKIYADIQEILAFITTKYKHVILMGDFNIDLLKNNRESEFFKNVILQPFSLHQIINKPTRITKKTSTLIDHIFVTERDSVKCSGVADFPGISDHCLIYMSYSLQRPKYKPEKVLRRNFKNFNEKAFTEDMERAPWGNIHVTDNNGQVIGIDDKVSAVESIFREYIDKHAPYREVVIKRPIKSSWMTDDILALMDNRDKYKNLYNTHKDDYFLNRFKECKNDVNHKIRRAKIAEFNESVNDKIQNSKSFHAALKKYNVVSSKKTAVVKCPFSPDRMNETFCASHNADVDFDKIAKTINAINLRPRKGGTFTFQEVSEGDIFEIVKSLKSNSCGVDDISAFFVKISIKQSVTAILDIINSSLRSGIFPKRWKKAIVVPIPKLDTPLSPSDFRPISLLSVLSKILEKVVSKQIVCYLTHHLLLDPNQSAYRKQHGCPTALLKITDDLHVALDKLEVAILTLLDYSKAFNCANHDILLAKCKSLGFSNLALTWVNSYLSGRSQKVKTSDGYSEWKDLANGVPQGSILGPLLFTILLNDFGEVINNSKYHLYADDSQIYITGLVSDIHEMIAKINSDLHNIFEFSEANNLSLNVGKCKYIIIGSAHNLKLLSEMDLANLVIDAKALKRESEVYDLGLLVDENLSWETQNSKTVASAYGKLRNAYQAKNFLSRKSKIAVVEYYVLSQLNYCNIVMQNLSQGTLSKIQKLQNACTRFIFGLRKFDHISAHFRQLNVLNMENRRLLHSATAMHKIVLKKAPTYLCGKIRYRNSFHLHNTRGNNKIHLPAFRNVHGRDRFFRKVAHTYNNIMDIDGFRRGMSVSCFKRKLKQHLIANQ